jgi:hypothetical protein
VLERVPAEVAEQRGLQRPADRCEGVEEDEAAPRKLEQPGVRVTAHRPPGIKRAIAISSPPRSVNWRPAHSIRRRDFSPPKKRLTTRVPKRRPIQYALLSPRNAPAAAAGTIIARLRSPALATTPAVITAVSLGTTGTTASSSASRNTIPYAHPEASETS